MKNYEILKQFYIEMNNLIDCYEENIKAVNYNTKPKILIYTFLQKIISNVKSANMLVQKGKFNEAKIILRGAIETEILIVYLAYFNEKIDEYLEDSQILDLKNLFISFNMTKENEISDIDGHKFSKQELWQNFVEAFHTRTISVQQRILKDSKIKELVLEDNIIDKLKKYYKNFKPFFMKPEDMYKDLDEAGFKLAEYSLRDILYGFYNDSSQVAHGSFYKWNYQIENISKELEYLFHFFIKVTMFLDVAIKDKFDLKIYKSSSTIMKKMRKAHENLEILIYGKILDHTLLEK